MKIAISHRKLGFSQGWIDYCIFNNIEYKIVNCYNNDIISQLSDCDALMWHLHHQSPKDVQFAKQLLYSVEISGKPVYPDFRTAWHFDDKLGQKYLLEAIGAPLVPSFAFYSLDDAIRWIKGTEFPKVFKLRGGSASINVKLVKSANQAIKLAKKAFSRGFMTYDSVFKLKDRWAKYRNGKETLTGVLKGLARIIFPTLFSQTTRRERGYIYFQEFIPGNTHDIRVTYVNQRCFALRRKVRPKDFRASGGGLIDYDMSQIPEKAILIAFQVADKLKLQSAAFDFVLFKDEPMIVEMSYGFGYDADQFNHGYWDQNLNYYPGTFDPYGWMVEDILERIEKHNNGI